MLAAAHSQRLRVAEIDDDVAVFDALDCAVGDLADAVLVLAVLAVALGVGFCAAPWSASAAPDGSGPNISVSHDGDVKVVKGTATAVSDGRGSTAVAHGFGSYAEATGGTNNHALASGVGSTAIAKGGNNNTATASGTNSTAIAAGGSNNTAKATGTDSGAYAGYYPGLDVRQNSNNNNYASANGDSATAVAGAGDHNGHRWIQVVRAAT